MNLQKFGVKELNNVEMQTIEGGSSWLGGAWDAVCDAASAAGEAIGNAWDSACGFVDEVICNTSPVGC